METLSISLQSCSTWHGTQLRTQSLVLLQTACTCIMHEVDGAREENYHSLFKLFLGLLLEKNLFSILCQLATQGFNFSHFKCLIKSKFRSRCQKIDNKVTWSLFLGKADLLASTPDSSKFLIQHQFLLFFFPFLLEGKLQMRSLLCWVEIGKM